LKKPSGNMKLRITRTFSSRLNSQIDFIARDKPEAARKFKTEVLKLIREIPSMPYKNWKSIFFEDQEIREEIYKGYLILYKIDKHEEGIVVFGFTKFEENPFNIDQD